MILRPVTIWLLSSSSTTLAQLEQLFVKPEGFHSDDNHNRYFARIDSDRDGLISRSELLSAIDANDAVFDYLILRRNVSLSGYNGSIDALPEALTYNDFMWFYRESSLFEQRVMKPPAPPSQLYSFPSWPGMKSTPSPEEPYGITPQRFWKEYVLPHRSVVIRNALKGSRALEFWSDPVYLVSQFGDLEAKLEHRFEARGDSLLSKLSKTGRASIRDIVEKKVDGYVVSVVPQPMAWEVNVPPCILCGDRDRPYLDLSTSFSFMTEIEETSLWISRGRTRSQFHYDKENTFNCMVTGEPKQWVIMDTRKYGDKVPWVRRGGYNMTDDMNTLYTDWVGVDVDNLDLNLHSYLVESEFEVLTQYPGDCVFLPYSMLHYAGHLVEDDTLQVAISYMWLPETKFNEKHCPQNPPSGIPLAVFDTVWYYSGFGAVPQGNHNPRHLERAIAPESGVFKKLAIVGFLPPGTKGTDEGFDMVLLYLRIVEELVKRKVEVPLDLWLQLSAAADMNGLTCNQNKTYIPRPFEEINKMFLFLEKLV